MNKSSVHRRISNGKVVREKLGWFIVFVMIVALSFGYGNLSVSSAAVNMNNIDTSVQGIIGVWRENPEHLRSILIIPMSFPTMVEIPPMGLLKSLWRSIQMALIPHGTSLMIMLEKTGRGFPRMMRMELYRQTFGQVRMEPCTLSVATARLIRITVRR